MCRKFFLNLFKQEYGDEIEVFNAVNGTDDGVMIKVKFFDLLERS